MKKKFFKSILIIFLSFMMLSGSTFIVLADPIPSDSLEKIQSDEPNLLGKYTDFEDGLVNYLSNCFMITDPQPIVENFLNSETYLNTDEFNELKILDYSNTQAESLYLTNDEIANSKIDREVTINNLDLTFYKDGSFSIGGSSIVMEGAPTNVIPGIPIGDPNPPITTMSTYGTDNQLVTTTGYDPKLPNHPWYKVWGQAYKDYYSGRVLNYTVAVGATFMYNGLCAQYYGNLTAYKKIPSGRATQCPSFTSYKEPIGTSYRVGCVANFVSVVTVPIIGVPVTTIDDTIEHRVTCDLNGKLSIYMKKY